MLSCCSWFSKGTCPSPSPAFASILQNPTTLLALKPSPSLAFAAALQEQLFAGFDNMSPEDQARVVKIQAVARGRAARAEVVAMRARQAAEAAAAEAEAALSAEASVEVGV